MVLRKHQWLIFSFLLAIVTLVTIGTFREQPIYDATTRIEIDRECNSILPFNGPDSAYGVDRDRLENYIETQSKILISQTLALETIKSLDLDFNPRFGGHPQDPGTIETSPAKGFAQPPPAALKPFLDGLSVMRVPNSRLLDVTFSATDPQSGCQES